MNWQPLFPRRNPQAGTDSAFEGMFEKALRQPTNKPPREAPNTTRLARLFALEHDWPLPQPERGRWRRCVLVILGALLAQIPKLGCEIDQIHAAFSVGESNFGEVGGGQRKRLLNSGFRCE